ncbi:hypothetical protein AA0111_g2088 [Alternaria arborescens]|uniref:hypothetical protein n=1 Tax=Alternaria arborescens TaxID=156630 RepID=UPI001075238D|nr:hypothetical protein AA0111_g2088 [Alternaria arborescens]RYO37567.1 hypothetical protein AA0111_g2088 [Alternaria arborescens]
MFSRIAQSFKKETAPPTSKIHRSTRNMSSKPSTTTMFRGLPVIPDETYTTNTPRKISKSFLAAEVEEGVGMRVRRGIGLARLPHLSPFIMLDHFNSTFGNDMDASAPDHPHRGQETISYIISGGVDHEDFAGNRGTLEAGDLQFMTAGRGIMHSEIPIHNGNGEPNVGMQLWVDLPKELKYCEPRYRDLKAKEIPEAVEDGGRVHVKVISGLAFGVESKKELSYTPVWYLHFTVQPGGSLHQSLPRTWNAFAYVLEGAIQVSNGSDAEAPSRSIGQFHMAVFEQEGDSVSISVSADAKEAANFILVAGLPLDQPIVQYGPFVVTSREEVQQAVSDFRRGENGFERAVGWVSENSKSRRNSVVV